MPGLTEALADIYLHLVTPESVDTVEERDAVRHIRYGVTSVDAAFASTGSMLMVSGKGKPRVASLLPYYHAALIPFSRLYQTVEAWMAVQREESDLEQLLRSNANITVITGPSKSADIEMHLTLGVHGPKHVHAILFDDTPPEPQPVRQDELLQIQDDDTNNTLDENQDENYPGHDRDNPGDDPGFSV